MDLYPTWQEASGAVKRLKIVSSVEYKRRRLEDPRLPAAPSDKYADFPGSMTFFGKKRPYHETKYATWQQAGRAAVKLGIRHMGDYRRKCSKDPKLPAHPERQYEDYPGVEKFLAGLRHYSTWQEASRAALALRISRSRDYYKRRVRDARLPSDPNSKYKDFPGWSKFLGKDNGWKRRKNRARPR